MHSIPISAARVNHPVLLAMCIRPTTKTQTLCPLLHAECIIWLSLSITRISARAFQADSRRIVEYTITKYGST